MVHAGKYTIHSVCGNGKDLSLVGPIQISGKAATNAGAIFWLSESAFEYGAVFGKTGLELQIMTLNN